MLKQLIYALPLAAGLVMGQEASESPTVEEKIVVTANRGETPIDEVGSSITVITDVDMEKAGYIRVAEALRDVPGLSVVQTGAPGGQTSVFMRGAASGHVLVLVDGVEVNDPISPDNSFDIAHLSTDNIERVEILRGPQSTLYGSDAMAGVIHIITKTADTPFKMAGGIQAGSFGTARFNGSISGRDERFSYQVSASHYETDGFSASSEALGNTEEDGYRNETYSLNLGLQATETFSLGLRARYMDSKGDIDAGGGEFGDDPNWESEANQANYSIYGDLDLMDGRWHQHFSLAMSDTERHAIDSFDDVRPATSSDGLYEADKVKLSWTNRLEINEMNTLSFGAENEIEQGSSVYMSESQWGPYTSIFEEEEAETLGIFVQDHITINDRAAVTLGARFDDHDRFGSETTWRAATSLGIANGFSFKGSVGTGFKAPSLFQLFSPFGDPELQAEESLGFDGGFHYNQNGLSANVTYFNNDYDQLIDYDAVLSRYNNIAEAETRGVETNIAYVTDFGISFDVSYTSLKTEDINGDELVRRPKNKWRFRLAYAFNKRGEVAVNLQGKGAREFNDFSTWPYSRVTLDSYTVTNMSFNYRLTNNLNLNLRGDNLFDEEYEEVLGYSVSEPAGYISLQYR